jgi:hypothetical protein
MKKRADVTVDFTGVESGGRAVADGNYVLEAIAIEEKESSEGNPYLAWKWKVMDDGPFKGATVYDNTSLKSTALWRLKGLLECMGVDVANGKQGINFGELKGKTVRAKIVNETYQGKEKPRIAEFLRGEVATTRSSGMKAGQNVTFDYDGEAMTGQVVSSDGDSVIVSIVMDDNNVEEWELDASELTVV